MFTVWGLCKMRAPRIHFKIRKNHTIKHRYVPAEKVDIKNLEKTLFARRRTRVQNGIVKLALFPFLSLYLAGARSRKCIKIGRVVSLL